MKLNYTDVRISINFIGKIGIKERGTGYSSATGIFLVQIACVGVEPFSSVSWFKIRRFTCRTHVANGGLSALMKLHQSNRDKKSRGSRLFGHAKNPCHRQPGLISAEPPAAACRKRPQKRHKSDGSQPSRRTRILLFARRVITTHMQYK